MNGVSRFLSKRERKPKGGGAESAAKVRTSSIQAEWMLTGDCFRLAPCAQSYTRCSRPRRQRRRRTRRKRRRWAAQPRCKPTRVERTLTQIEQQIKAVTLRLTQLGITNLRDAQIEYALRAKTTNGDVDKAADLLGVFEDSVEGIVRDYQPTLKLLGAENRQAVTCYLDALLFAMFAKLDSFEALLFDTFTDTPRKNLASLLRLWVNMLRSGKLITTDVVCQNLVDLSRH